MNDKLLDCVLTLLESSEQSQRNNLTTHNPVILYKVIRKLLKTVINDYDKTRKIPMFILNRSEFSMNGAIMKVWQQYLESKKTDVDKQVFIDLMSIALVKSVLLDVEKK